MDEKFEGIYITTAGTTTPAVDLGSNNCAMFEVRMIAKSTAGNFSVAMEGGNDGVNWPEVLTVLSPAITAAPDYVAVPYNTAIPYRKVRFRATLASGTGIFDIATHTFRTS